MNRRARLIALALIGLVALPSGVVLVVGAVGLFFVPERSVRAYVAPSDLVWELPVRPPTDEAVRASYEHFVGKPAFAAFAADDAGHWGYATGKHAPEAARAQALAWCEGDCAVMVEYQPEGYRPDPAVQTVNDAAAAGMVAASAVMGGAAVYYSLAEDGSWAVQMPEDGEIMPQWAVLNRCRDALEASARPWPAGLPAPQCRLFRGPIITQ